MLPPIIFWRHIVNFSTTHENLMYFLVTFKFGTQQRNHGGAVLFFFITRSLLNLGRPVNQVNLISSWCKLEGMKLATEAISYFGRKKTCICCIYNEQSFSSFSACNTLRFSYGGCRLIETWEQNKNRLPKQHWGISLEKVDLNNIKYLATNYYFWHPLI